MKPTTYLKGQLQHFVDSYKRLFNKTINTSLSFAVVFFIGAAFLFHYSTLNQPTDRQQSGLISYFIFRFSQYKTYSLTDLIKPLFFFCVAVFSTGVIRFGFSPKTNWSTSSILETLTAKDIVCLVSSFAISCITDYVLFRINESVGNKIFDTNKALYLYLFVLSVHLRNYLPLIAYSLTIYYLINGHLRISTRRLFLFLLSLWIFNELAFQFLQWIQQHILSLLLLLFIRSDNYNLYESLLSIPLFALLFPGYYSAMTYFITSQIPFYTIPEENEQPLQKFWNHMTRVK